MSFGSGILGPGLNIADCPEGFGFSPFAVPLCADDSTIDVVWARHWIVEARASSWAVLTSNVSVDERAR